MQTFLESRCWITCIHALFSSPSPLHTKKKTIIFVKIFLFMFYYYLMKVAFDFYLLWLFFLFFLLCITFTFLTWCLPHIMIPDGFEYFFVVALLEPEWSVFPCNWFKSCVSVDIYLFMLSICLDMRFTSSWDLELATLSNRHLNTE